MIHASLKADNALNYYHLDFVQPYWIEIFKLFFAGILANAAVPLFFLFSSYIQFSKNEKYTTLLKKRSKTVLLPYVIWTLITILLFFIAQSIPQTKDFFQNPDNQIRTWNFIDWIKAFTYKNFNEVLYYPFVYQFWFLRELMIFTILSPILKFLCKKCTGLVIILIVAVNISGIPLFFTVSNSALFFYLLGYFFAEYKIDFFKLADKIKFWEYGILLFLTVFFTLAFDGKYNFKLVTIIISCLFFLKLSKMIVDNSHLWNIAKYLSGFSFFLYACHTPFLGTTINKLTMKYIPLHGINCLIQFLLAWTLTCFLGTFAGIILKKICPPFFRVLNGGR